MLKRAIILGIGSPFGADRFGLDAARVLERHPRLRPNIPARLEVIACDRPGTAVLTYFQGADLVVLVDAVLGSGEAGRAYRFVDTEAFAVSSPLSGHGFGLGETLALANVMGLLPQRMVLFGAEVGPQWAEGKIAQQAFDAVIAAVVDEVCAYLDR